MKRFLVVLALLFVAPMFGQTAAQKITAGRAALAAHDIAAAKARFEEALVISPTSQTAHALLGLTRVFAATGQASANSFLDGLNVPATGRNVYDWTAQLPQNGNGDVVLPSNYNLTTVEALWQGTLIPAMTAARGNLAAVTNTSFLLTLSGAELGSTAAVTLDYGDVLMSRASLSAVEFVFNFLSGQNLNANLAAMNELAQGDMLTFSRVLTDNADVLKVGDPAKRVAAKAALTEFIALYRQASAFIRARAPGLDRMFMLDPSDLVAEADFRSQLDKLELSFTEAVEVAPNGDAVFTGPIFGPTWSIRSDVVPEINAATGGFKLESIDDNSLGGVVAGLTRERIASAFDGPELGWEWISPNPPANTLNRVLTLGDGKRIAVGGDGNVLTSVDGSTWIWRQGAMRRAPRVTGLAEGAGANAGKVVAVGDLGRIFISIDSGATWRQVLEEFGVFRGVAYGAGRFVAVGDGGVSAVSTDGEKWNVSYENTPALNDVIFVSGGYFLAVGRDAAANRAVIVTSADGVSWSNRLTAAATGYTFAAVLQLSDKIVVVGTQNRKAISASLLADSSWSEGTILASGTNTYRGLAFRSTGSLLVAVGDTGLASPAVNSGVIATSSDGGANWTAVVPGSETAIMNGVSVASDGVYFALNGGVLLRSTDLTTGASTFARAVNPGSAAPVAAVPTNTTLNSLRAIDGKLYAVGSGDAIMVSTDGHVFSPVVSGTSGKALWGIIKQGSTFYVVGDTGTILTSGDGAAPWTPIISGNSGTSTTQNLRFIGYLNGQFIVTGAGGTILTSPTGATNTWTSRTTQGGIIYGVAYGVVGGTGTYVAVGGNDNNSASASINFVYTSTDGGATWVRRFPPTSATFRAVVFHQGYFTAVGFDGTIFRSTNGINWEQVHSDAGTDIVALRVLGGRYYALQRTRGSFFTEVVSAVLVSTDGSRWTRVEQGTIINQFGVELFDGPSPQGLQLYTVGAGASVLRSGPIQPPVTPVLTALTASRQVNQGGTIALAVANVGGGSLTYQWKKGGVDVTAPDASDPVLNLKNVQPADAGSYTLTVTNAAGVSATSSPIVVTVSGSSAAPVIVAQPESQTVPVGLTVSFSVDAVGTAPLAYQWKKNGSNVINSATVTGATTATLTLLGVQGLDSGYYTVEVSNGTTPVAVSAPAVLTVESSPAYTFSTLAGVAGLSGSTNTTTGPGSQARFNGPFGTAVDSSGNLYVADRLNHTIRKIVISTGIVSTLAGTGASGGAGTAGTTVAGNAATFNNPQGVAFDSSSGSLFVADYNNSAIRKINLTAGANFGAVTTFATGIDKPNFIVVSTSTAAGMGTVYFTTESNRVRKITADGATSSIFAGSSTGAAGSVNGNGTAARFNNPQGIGLDSAGNLFVSDFFGNVVRKITPQADVTTFTPYSLFPGIADGPALVGTVNYPVGLAVDSLGNVYVTEGSGGQVVRKISPQGFVRTIGGEPYFGGAADGVGPHARFNNPIGITVDAANNIYIADNVSNTIRKGVPSAALTAPVIDIPPTDQEVGVGSNVTFAATAVGNTPLTYQWRKNGVNIDGATSSTYTLAGAQLAAAGDYTVAVTNAQGTAVSPIAKLAVNVVPPTITSPSPNGPIFSRVIVAGDSVTLSVSATGTTPFTYQWFKDSEPISGATNSTLELSNVQPADGGPRYTATVTNASGIATSRPIDVVVATEEPYAFSVLAGRATAGAANGALANATFNNPGAIAKDSAGNLYIADAGNHLVRKIAVDGTVSILAGAPGTAGSTNGSGSAARFNNPLGIAVDGSGNIFVADTGNHSIRKITSAGEVSVFAGASGSFGVVNGNGGTARFNQPSALAFDGSGNLFVADQSNFTVRKITSTGDVTLVAGLPGNQGNTDGSAGSARLGRLRSIALDGAGNIYVGDTNRTVRKIDSSGAVNTIAGLAGSSGSTDANGTSARFSTLIAGLAVDGSGNIFVADSGNHTLRRIAANGDVTTLAGTAGLPGAANDTGAAARFFSPGGLLLDGSGNLLVADSSNSTLRKVVVATRVVTTLSGTPPHTSGVDGTGSVASFRGANDAALDAAGNIYVADTSNHTIRKMTPQGVVTTIAGTAGVSGSTDATGAAARFNAPSGLTVGTDGTIYVADTNNFTVRKITTGGVVTTLAGTAGVSGFADGTGAAAQFRAARDVTVDGSGNLYVADTTNHSIRKITPGGMVTTLAGLGNTTGFADGTAESARFNNPWHIVWDGSVLWVADRSNAAIRRVTLGGVVTTVTGTQGPALGIAVDGNGNIYYAASASVWKYLANGETHFLGGGARTVTTGSTSGIGSDALFGSVFGFAATSTGQLYVPDAVHNTVSFGSLPSAPGFSGVAGPAVVALNPGGTVDLLPRAAVGVPVPTLQWEQNTLDLSGASSASLQITNAQPSNAGIYRLRATNALGASYSEPILVGIKSSSKVMGGGTEVGADIVHPAGFVYDQILMTGPAVTVTADLGQVVRVSFIDPDDDLVTLEFAGAGALSVVLDGATGPAAPAKYNQPSVSYMKGRATVTVVGANETSSLSIFSVGTATATNQALFRSDVTYDGVADIAAVALSSSNGRFDAVRTANARFSAAKGVTGIYAPGITFSGPVFVGDIAASGSASPMLVLGSASDVRVLGGDLLQANAASVRFAGFSSPPAFAASVNSHGVALPALTNQATFAPFALGPTFTSSAQAAFLVGQTNSFTLAAAGAPLPTYTMSGTTPPWLTLNANTGVLSGNPPNTTGSPFTFAVSATNASGTAIQNNFTLTVNVAPTFAVQPVSAQIVLAGQPITYTVVANGVPAPSLQWRRNGAPVADATAATYTVPSAQGSHAGFYDVVATSTAGTATSQVSTLTVAPAGGDTFPNFVVRNPLPASATLRGITYGDGKFVAVGQGGRIFTSADGTTWSTTPVATVPSSITLNAVAHNLAQTQFVAVGSNGDIYTAPHGTLATWTKQTSGTTEWLNGVAVGSSASGPVVVAVGNNGRVVTSVNGAAFTVQTLTGSPRLNAVAATANLFAAVGDAGILFTSTDGATWTSATAPAGMGGTNFTGVRYLNGQFVAVASSGALAVWTGTGAWTQTTSSISRSLRDIAYSGTTYVAVADNGDLLRGTTLGTWTLVDPPTSAAFFSVATNGTTFAAVGSGGEIWSSGDTTAWTPRASLGGIFRFGAGEFLNNQFIAVGSQGALFTSDDADFWSRRSLPVGHWLDAAAYGLGLYVVPTDFGDILTSSNGQTWTNITVGDNVNNNGAAFDGTRFVVVGDAGKIRTSINGTSWSNVTGTGITANLRSVAVRGGLFVAVGDSGKIYTSPQGTAWTERTSGTTQRLNRVRAIDGMFFAVGDSRTLLMSADGIAWVPLPISTSIGFSYRDIARLSDGFYLVGDQGTLIKTTDFRTATLAATLAFGETLNTITVGAGRAVIVGDGGAMLESRLPAASATPTIAVPPLALTTDATKTVVLSVVANASGPITYQWRKDNVDILGATSSTYVIPNATTAASGSYTVVVTSGGTPVTSAAAAVVVNAVQAPAITALPIVAQAVTGNAGLSVTATGTSPLTYQWYRGASGVTTNPVSTNASFNVTNLQNSDRYWVRVTNGLGQTLNSATTNVLAWTPRNPTHASNSINAFASDGAGTYVAVGFGNVILRYTGTGPWTRSTGITGTSLRGAAYGAGTANRFVVVGDNGFITTSGDGTTWASATSTSTSILYSVIYDAANARFVAVGAGGTVLTSATGTGTWTAQSLGANTSGVVLRGIAAIPSGYVAVGDNGTIYTGSSDATTWTLRALTPASTAQLNSVAYNGTKLVIGGSGGTLLVSTDATGTAWAPVTSAQGNNIPSVIALGSSSFLAASPTNYVISADHGATWSPLQNYALGGYSANVAFNAGGGTILTGGYPGLILGTTTVETSNSWTPRHGVTAISSPDVIYGNGRFVTFGINGTIGRSNDGATWTVLSPAVNGVTTTLRRATYGKGLYVVVGDGGRVLMSGNAQNWSSTTAGTANLTAVVYAGGKFIAAGAGGATASSNDGFNWTTGAAIGTAAINGLDTNGSVIVAVNSAGGIFSSTDGANWTARASGVSTALNNVAYVNGRFIAVGASSVVLTSTDGVTWTSRNVGVANLNFGDVAYGDGVYILTQNNAASAQTTLYLSPDTVTWNASTPSSNLIAQNSASGITYANGTFVFTGGSGLITQTVPAPDTLRITTPPAGQSIANGDTVALSVTAIGATGYQWYEGLSGDLSSPVGGATTATFTTPPLLQSKNYWVRVFGPGGASADSATVSLLGAPTIVNPPSARIVNDGSAAVFTVNALGAPTLSFQWLFNGNAIAGANGPVYNIPAATFANAGNYSVRVENSQGSVTTSPVSLSLTPVAPTVGNVIASYGRVSPAGANTVLSLASVSGSAPLSYQWRFNGVDIVGATKSEYFLAAPQQAQAGNYTVRVTNGQGSATSGTLPFAVSRELGWQRRNPLPTGNGLSTVQYLGSGPNARFYLGGVLGTLLTSTDGATWTQRVIPGAANIIDLTEGGGLLVALGGANSIFTSADGINWSPRDAKVTDTQQLQSIAFGGSPGRFVAAGGVGRISTSTDGVNWTPGFVLTSANVPTTDYLYRVRFVNNQFLLSSYNDAEEVQLWSSADGLAWTKVVTTPATLTLEEVAFGIDSSPTIAGGAPNPNFGNGVYAATSDRHFRTSTNGTTWTQQNYGSTGLPAASYFTAIRRVNNRFIALGSNGEIAVSGADGTGWTLKTSGVVSSLNDVAFGNGVYVIAGSISEDTNLGSREILTSSDGETWTRQITGPAQATALRAVATDGTNLVAVAHPTATIVRSTNGNDWAAIPSANASNNANGLFDVTFGGGRFVAVGNAATVLRSEDSGQNWTAGTGISSADLRGVAYGLVGTSDTYVAVGTGGRIATSATGATWTTRTSGTSANLSAVVFATGTNLGANSAGLFVVTGGGGGIFTSPDGVTWTPRTSGFASGALNGIGYGNGRFVVVGSGGLVTTSTDGVNWTPLSSFSGESLTGVTYAAGAFLVATASQNAYFVSPDGLNFTARYTGATDGVIDMVAYGNQVIATGANGAILAAGAPLIVSSPPPAIAARAGSTLPLTALVAASPTAVTYQWRKDNVDLPGATSPTLVLNSITAANAGSYTLVATNSITSTTSPATVLTVTLAATFTSQPQSVTAVAGQTVTFTANATGTPAPTYQWQKDGVDLTNAAGSIAGATSATLTLTNVQPGSVGTYRAIARNTINTIVESDTSLPATLTVNVPATAVISSATPAIVSNVVVADAGTAVTLNATGGGTGPLTYQWRRNGLNLGNGPAISGATTASLTLNPVGVGIGGTFTVAVTNVTGTTVSSPVTLTIDPPPPVIISPLVVSGVQGSNFVYLTAINATTATFAATNLPAGLSIDTATGVISGVPTAVGTTNNIQLTASNVSSAGITRSNTKTLTIVINPPPPVITSPVAVLGRVGVPLTYNIVATNSPSANGYSSGTLPPGLTRTDGVITGTPTTAGTYNTIVGASNATGGASKPVQFTIQPAASAPVYSGPTQPSGTQGVTFTFTPVFSGSPTLFEIVAGALPTGVTLDPATGVISGTPTAVGSFGFTLKASKTVDTITVSTTVVLTIVVNPAASAPVIVSESTANATVSAPFSFTLLTDVPATAFTAAPLPAGLTLDTATGIISGTPSASGTVNVQVAAAAGTLTGPTSILIITVNPSASAPVISSAPVIEGRVGEPFTFTLLASNGANDFVITSGTLPANLGLTAASGLISGTPAAGAVGDTRVWFAARNTIANTGFGPAMEVLFRIRPAANVPVITSNGTATGQVGQLFSYAITATNGPTAFTASGLPVTWMTRNGAQISGIPPVATTEPITIVVGASNGDGASEPKTVTITIAPAPATPIITSAGSISGRVGLAFSYTITASAGASSFSALDLPPGLSLDPATGIVSGLPTQAGPFAVTLSAANAAGVGPNSPLLVTIAPAPTAPAVASAASVTGKVGQAFSYAILPAPPTITSYGVTGTLPLGLSVNTSTGIISGNPAEPGVFLVQLTVTNANGTSSPQPVVLVINPADNVPVVVSPIYALGTVGAAFNYTIAATNMPGSTPFPAPIVLEAVGLPPGLAVNPSTGAILGSPSVAGVFVATLVGTNAAGTGPMRSLTIFVQPAAAAPVITSSLSAAAQVGTAFSYQIAATNNPLGFEVLGAPAWMTINGQSGAINGTPTLPGVFTAQLVASNGAGASNPATLTLFVAAAAGTPVITSSRAAGGQLGTAFSYTITATATPTSYVATGLPAGLRLNGNVIEGTPTSSGVFPVTISANNVLGGNPGFGQPVTLFITIDPSLQLTFTP